MENSTLKKRDQTDRLLVTPIIINDNDAYNSRISAQNYANYQVFNIN